jgi:GNAT superfamily N-acetyltransferase
VPTPVATPVPEHVRRFWRSIDDRFQRVEPTWWGAVITDARYPAVWDANYARIDLADAPPLDDVERALLPALREAGSSVEHLVSFEPAATETTMQPLVARGHALTWGLVMERTAEPTRAAGVPPPVDEITAHPRLWDRVAASLALFGPERDEVVEQLTAIEREVLAPAGKRWFGVRDEHGVIDSLGAVTVLDDVAYIDNVATFEHARGRGLASAVTATLVDRSVAGGASRVVLFADPQDAAVVRMYERLGFRAVGGLAATRGPVPT